MSFIKHKRSVDDIWPMYNKVVLIRVDFNIAIKNGIIVKGKDQCVGAALPTIRRVIDQGGKAILLSHMGRPTGHKYSVLKDQPEKRLRYLQIWADERGKGLTTFFSLCSGQDKKRILSWSSRANFALTLSDANGSGKTDVFVSLTTEEKSLLLDKFTKEMAGNGQNCKFPQLRQYLSYQEELTLFPVATRLSELLNEERTGSSTKIVVKFAEDCMNADDSIQSLEPGEVLLLENVRFYSDDNSRDETERRAMALRMSSYGDYFVSDAFGTAHRNSATVVGIPLVLGHGCCGYQMRREIEAFVDILVDRPRPMVVIVGGVKVSDKILLLENILPCIDYLIIGGAMAFTFLNANGVHLGKSFHEAGQSFLDRYGEVKNIDELARRLLSKAKSCNVRILLPSDHICHTSCDPTDSPYITHDDSIPSEYMALDIGPKTVEHFQSCISLCRTAVWTGPMGVFEYPMYSTGSYAVAKAMGDGTQDRGLVGIIAGSASARCAELCGHATRVTHVSSGGGAVLDILGGAQIPGISVLDDV